jgi:hypothetical protein
VVGFEPNPVFAHIGCDRIEPREDIIPPSQTAKFLISLDEHFLSDILGIVEVAEFGICKRVYAALVFVHQKAKGLWLSFKAFADNVSIFRPHFDAPIEIYWFSGDNF